MPTLKRCPICGRKRADRDDWSDESKWIQPAKGNRQAVTMRFFECEHCRFEIALTLAGKRRKNGKKLWKAIFKTLAKECES
ncbi:MAG: hypothetical protein ACREJ2_16390 [Planctomycetota bacterium]